MQSQRILATLSISALVTLAASLLWPVPGIGIGSTWAATLCSGNRYANAVLSSTLAVAPPANVLGQPDGLTASFDNNGAAPGFVVVAFSPETVVVDGEGPDLAVHLLDFFTGEIEDFIALGSADGISFTPFTVVDCSPLASPNLPKTCLFDLAGTGLTEVRQVMIQNATVIITHPFEGPDIDAIEALNCGGCEVPGGGGLRVAPNNIVSGLTCGSAAAASLRSWTDEAGNKFELFCQDIPNAAPEFHLKYKGRRVGRCPWGGGRNFGEILHAGDSDSDGKFNCFLSSFWRSREPGTTQGVANVQDWKTYTFSIATGNLVLRHFTSPDGPGGSAPDTKIDEKTNVDPLDFDPPTGSPPMIADPFDPCDVDRDGDCDTADFQLVTNAIGQCDDGDKYNELADADHDGCISITDRDILASSDFDSDGVLGFNDACSNSDLSPMVIIDGCNSGVPNTLSSTGCTISDQIGECAVSASNHGKFVSCVSQLTNDLKKAGTITDQQKGAIQSCAARANIP